MRSLKYTLTLAAVAASWAGGSTVQAEEGKDTGRAPLPKMSETAAPFTKPTSTVTLGGGYLKGHREQLGIFDNQRSTGTRGILDANVSMRDDAEGAWTTARARNLGLDNQEARLGYNRQGDWGLSLDYTQIPRTAPYTAVTNIQGLGSNVMLMPNTSNNGRSGEFQIGTERERVSLDTFKFLNQEFKFNLNFKNEKKEGTRHWGRGSAPEFAVEPISWTTRQLESSLSFLGKSTQLTGGYYGSWFENATSLVDSIRLSDSPATLGNHTYLSTALDNEAHQLFFQGGHNFTPATRATFKFSHTRALQNEPIDTDSIQNLANAFAPSSLHGRIDTNLVNLGLTTEPLPKLKLVTTLRYYSETDKTPNWLTVRTTTADVHATALSNETLSGKVEGIYRLPQSLSLTTSVERKQQDRKIPFGNDNNRDGLDNERFVPFRSDLDETTYLVQLRRALSQTLNGSIGVSHAEREGSKFTDATGILGNSQGKISPFFIADRTREKVRLALDWAPIQSVNVQFNFENAHDTYEPDSQPFGRKKGEARLYSVDADYAFSNKLLFNTWYSHDVTETWQTSGRWSGTTSGTHDLTKNSILKDTGDSVGLGVRNQVEKNIKVGSNVQWTMTKSMFNDAFMRPSGSTAAIYGNGLSPLLDIRSSETKFNTFLEYANLGPGILRFDYMHERWHTNDWTWQFSNGAPFSYGTTTDGTMIVTREHQSANFFGVRYTTKF